jgi:hypothetical protein
LRGILSAPAPRAGGQGWRKGGNQFFGIVISAGQDFSKSPSHQPPFPHADALLVVVKIPSKVVFGYHIALTDKRNIS